MMGNEKDLDLENFDQYFVFVRVFFFVCIEIKLFGGLICFCFASHSCRVWKWGEQSFMPCAGLVDAHFMLQLQAEITLEAGLQGLDRATSEPR